MATQRLPTLREPLQQTDLRESIEILKFVYSRKSGQSLNLKRNYLLDQVFSGQMQQIIGKILLPTLVLQRLENRKIFYDYLASRKTILQPSWPSCFLIKWNTSRRVLPSTIFLRPPIGRKTIHRSFCQASYFRLSWGARWQGYNNPHFIIYL